MDLEGVTRDTGVREEAQSVLSTNLVAGSIERVGAGRALNLLGISANQISLPVPRRSREWLEVGSARVLTLSSSRGADRPASGTAANAAKPSRRRGALPRCDALARAETKESAPHPPVRAAADAYDIGPFVPLVTPAVRRPVGVRPRLAANSWNGLR